jgi:hypothetical protein
MGRDPLAADRLVRLGRVLLLLGVLCWPLAWLVDTWKGVEVTVLLRERTADEREAWRRGGWKPGDGVAALYGTVEPPPGRRLIVWDESRLVRPPEAPGLVLLPLDRGRGGVPLPARALRFRAACLGLGLGLLGAFCLWRASRRAAPRA